MIRRVCLTVLLLLPALPAYAGHGTIRETDTQIFIEYTGDDNEILASKVLKEEEQKITTLNAIANEKVQIHKQELSNLHKARSAERRKEEE